MSALLSTRAKLGIARLLYRAVRGARWLGGHTGDEVECRRGGIRWHLDLREGIDLSIYLFGRFEPSTARALWRELTPGSLALDVGANIGSHTLPMAARVGAGGRVFAFEATEWAHARLLRNLGLNPELAASVTPVHAVLGDGRGAGEQRFYSSWNVMEYDRPGRPVHGGAAHAAGAAQRVRVDDYLAGAGVERVDLIKLDVDGFEPPILAGAAATLDRMRPRILLELCPNALAERGHALADLVEPLTSRGYRLCEERSRRPIVWGSMEELERRIPRGGSINALAVPPG